MATDAQKARFLEALREHPNVARACRAAEVAYQAMYALRRRDADFAATWDEAWREGVARVEEVTLERGLEGESDTNLRFMLKALLPEKYGDRAPDKPTEPFEIRITYVEPRMLAEED